MEREFFSSYAALADVAHHAGRLAVEALKAWGPALLVAAGVPLAAWIACARGLRGRGLALWLAVPGLLLLALVCFLGPGHLFPKSPFEGPTLVRVSHRHALTALDLVGLACTGSAVPLGARLILARLGALRAVFAA